MTRQARIAIISAVFTGTFLIAATPVAAHGIGGRSDLPVPVSFFIVGAGIAIVVSFMALAALWPEPRLQDPLLDRPLTGRWIPYLRSILGIIGLLGLMLVILAGTFNRDGGRTIGPVLVWVYLWLVVPFLAVVLGNWWSVISPWRLIARWVNSDALEQSNRGKHFGVWPAAAAFVAFTWLELVADSSSNPRSLAVTALLYSIYILVITRLLGVKTGLATGGLFENYNRVIGSISTLKWDIDSSTGNLRILRRGWLRGLTGLRDTPGLTFFIVAMIGTVTYDGISGAEWWSQQTKSLRGNDFFETSALLGTIAVIGTAYWLASAIAGRMAGRAGHAVPIARTFAHSLVPIAFAYAFAHYFTLIVIEGQTLLHATSDPFGLGWNLFGTANWRIAWVPAPEIVWYIQVAVIVIGHIVGVILAHDRSLHEFGKEVAIRTQYAMLFLMVLLTALGLLILSG